MPLHFDAITNDYKNTAVLAWVLQDGMDAGDAVFVSSNRRYIHLEAPVCDVISQKEIGRIVYTIKNDEENKRLVILDLDFILHSDEDAAVRFLEKRSGSSEANEYYEIETVAQEQHLVIETVNRYTVPENIEGCERTAGISVFPFKLSVFQSMATLNGWAGLDKGKEIGKTGIRVGGFSETFAMPGGMFTDEGDDHDYSLLFGRVKSFQDVRVCFGETSWDFVLASVVTALGTVPVAMSREVFDLSALAEDAIVVMNAYVKADLSKPEDFHYKGE